MKREQITIFWREMTANYHVLVVTDATSPAEVDEFLAELEQIQRPVD